MTQGLWRSHRGARSLVDEKPEVVDGERWVVVRLYGKHAEKDPRALSGRRAQTGTLVRGGGTGEASCRLVGEADPEEVMAEGPEEYLYLLRVSEIRKHGMDVVRSPDKGGPGHCDIVGAGAVRPSKRRKLLSCCLWVTGYAPPDVGEEFLADMILGQEQPGFAVEASE